MKHRIGKVALAVVTAAALAVPIGGVAQADAATTTAPAKPAQVKVKRVASTKPGTITVKIKKVAKAKGYQIQVAKVKTFKKGVKTKKITGVKYTFSGLSQGSKYFVHVRAYAKAGKKTAYGKWSKTLTVKVAKKAASEPTPAPEPTPSVDPKNSGVIDTSKAARGQESIETTLEEARSYNQIDVPADDALPSVAKRSNVTYKTVFNSTVDKIALGMDIFTPSTAKVGVTPLVVFVGDGNFCTSSTTGNIDMRLALAEAGYVVASVEHRVIPSANFPAPLQDIKTAIRFLKANSKDYKFDPNKVCVVGVGSGGYYATMLATANNCSSITMKTRNFSGQINDTVSQLDLASDGYMDVDSTVNAAVSINGISDLTIIGSGLSETQAKKHQSAASPEAILVNGAAAAQKGVSVFDEGENNVFNIAAASPFSYIDSNDAAIYLISGADDAVVSPVSSKMLAGKLEAAGVAFKRDVIAGAGHDDAVYSQPEVLGRIIAFLDEHNADVVDTTAVEANTASGTQAYKAEDLPTLEQSIEGAEAIAPVDQYYVTETSNISYKSVASNGTSAYLTMDILVPEKAGSSQKNPCFVFLNCGGFYTSKKDSSSIDLRMMYAKAGFTVASVQIRTTPQNQFPIPIQDCKSSIRWLKAHADAFNIDTRCFIVDGWSAGGYFSSMTGVLSNTTQYNDEIQFDVGENLDQSSAVQGVIDRFGVSDLTIIGAGLSNYDVHDSESNTEALFANGLAFGETEGASVYDDLDKTAILSPFTYLDENDPDFLFLHGTEDTSVSPIATMEFYKRCKALGLDAERYSYLGANHGGAKLLGKDARGKMLGFAQSVAAKHCK